MKVFLDKWGIAYPLEVLWILYVEGAEIPRESDGENLLYAYSILVFILVVLENSLKEIQSLKEDKSWVQTKAACREIPQSQS